MTVRDDVSPRRKRRTADVWPQGVVPVSHFDALVASTVGLLAEPWTFTQTKLLGPSDFMREARRRGVELWDGQLEQLHRRRLLVPFFHIASRPKMEPPDVDEGHVLGLQSHVLRAALEGRVVDPALRAFRRWPRSGSARYLYSEYQLLTCRELIAISPLYEARRVDDDVEWTLPTPDPRLVEILRRSRDLAIILEMLAPRYRPAIMRVIHRYSDALEPFTRDASPLPAWAPLVADPGRLQAQGEALLHQANTFDPLGKWMRVARIGTPKRWDELRFDALLALEFRIAAEHFLRLHDDLVELRVAEPLPPVERTGWHHIRYDRLRVDARERAEAVLDFGLGDTPAVVIAVEGETEMTLAPKLFATMGLDDLQGLIHVVNLKAVNGDVRLLARGVAVPHVDPDGLLGARVLRRLTGLVVAVDPEGRYRTDADCERERQSIVDELLSSVPEAIRTDKTRSQLEHLIVVRTWGPGGSFEYAHFSDQELARGIRSVAGTAAPSFADLVNLVAQFRAADGNLKNLWKNWPVKMSKPALAEALWPVLQRRVLHPAKRKNVPIVAVFDEALGLAVRTMRVREILTKG